MLPDIMHQDKTASLVYIVHDDEGPGIVRPGCGHAIHVPFHLALELLLAVRASAGAVPAVERHAGDGIEGSLDGITEARPYGLLHLLLLDMLPLHGHPPGKNHLHVDEHPGAVLDETEVVHVDPIVVTAVDDGSGDRGQHGFVRGVHGIVHGLPEDSRPGGDYDQTEHSCYSRIQPPGIVSHRLGDVHDGQSHEYPNG